MKATILFAALSLPLLAQTKIDVSRVNNAAPMNAAANITAPWTFTVPIFQSCGSAPGNSVGGKVTVYCDSSSTNFAVKNSTGIVKHMVQTQAASSNLFVTGISDDGTVSIAAITSGALPSSAVQNNQGNTYSGANTQDFSAISHVRLPVATGYTPTLTGHIGYDSTAARYMGFTGSVAFAFAMTAGARTAGKCLEFDSNGNITVAVSNTACGAGGGGANALGTYLVQSSTNAPANAFNLGSLSTGIVKITVSGGTATPAVASAGDFPTFNQDTTGSAAKVGGITVTGVPSVGMVPTATSSSAATWQVQSGGGGASSYAALVSGVGTLGGTGNRTLTIPTTLSLQEAQGSTPFAVPASATCTAGTTDTGTMIALYAGDQSGIQCVTNLPGATVGGGMTLVPGTTVPPIPNSIEIARVTFSSGTPGSVDQSRFQSAVMHDYVFNGPVLATTNSNGKTTINAFPRICGVQATKTTDFAFADLSAAGTCSGGDTFAQVPINCGSACAGTLPQAGSTVSGNIVFANGTVTELKVFAASSAFTLKATSSTITDLTGAIIAGATGVVLPAGTYRVTSTGSNYSLSGGAGSGGGGATGAETIVTATNASLACPAAIVFVELWGAGAGGGGGTTAGLITGDGGSGGGYTSGWCGCSGTVAVTVGTGGSGAAIGSGGAGTDGGDTSFGSCLKATGGKATGGNRVPGYDNALGTATAYWIRIDDGTNFGFASPGVSTDGSHIPPRVYVPIRRDLGGVGAISGNGSTTDAVAGRPSNYGGGGGASGAANASTNQASALGGASGYGGAGGTAGAITSGTAAACTAGSTPGGGGGGGAADSAGKAGCAGARGEVRIWQYH